MKDIIKKLISFPIFLIFTTVIAFSQSYSIDYYGIVSQNLDNNMAKMTSDLYYTQLSEMSNFTIYDNRTTPSRSSIPDFSPSPSDHLVFYAEILKSDSDDAWSVNFNLLDKSKNQEFTKSKSYDSFYKILMESKNELSSTINELVNENPIYLKTKENEIVQEPAIKTGDKIQVTSTEQLSGTWVGEKSIDKIVILRGGRGFVIFKNGASMNISVTLENNGMDVIVQQKGNSNASFYPELPRNIALDVAISAPPIKWTMALIDNSTMNGTKNTLVPDNSSYKLGEIDVTWTKIN